MKFALPVLEEDDGIQMAPMIDMVFLLLIFFMAASHLNQLEKVEIEVPVARHAAVPDDLLDRRTITIQADGSLYLGNRPGVLEEITPLVRKELAAAPMLKIYVRADERVRHRRVREVMKACADAGAAEVIFAAYETE
jgi:biopolymer transport protein ExbD